MPITAIITVEIRATKRRLRWESHDLMMRPIPTIAIKPIKPTIKLVCKKAVAIRTGMKVPEVLSPTIIRKKTTIRTPIGNNKIFLKTACSSIGKALTERSMLSWFLIWLASLKRRLARSELKKLRTIEKLTCELVPPVTSINDSELFFQIRTWLLSPVVSVWGSKIWYSCCSLKTAMNGTNFWLRRPSFKRRTEISRAGIPAKFRILIKVLALLYLVKTSLAFWSWFLSSAKISRVKLNGSVLLAKAASLIWVKAVK